jgi:CDGSH-type Zn-finger protein
MTEEKSIRITEGGAYIVSGSVPISEKIITPEGKGYVWGDGTEIEQKSKYALCRCGRTEKAPFCDGNHTKGVPFRGKETASRKPYDKRAHTDRGDVWKLTKRSDDPENYEMALKAANECPTGRLAAYDKDGTPHEAELEQEIIVVQDPEKACSGGYFVKGGIKLISSDGEEYETRNRYVLCRCGASRDTPFCDASHVSRHFNDKK